MDKEQKQDAAAVVAIALVLILIGLRLREINAAAPQGDYPRVIIEGKADPLNGGLPHELAMDNHGVPLGNSVSTFNAAQGGAIAHVGYAQGQAQPAWVQPIGEQVHIAATTATSVKATSGILVQLNVNTPAAGTISIFDLAAAGCTGTPATNTVAIVTATAIAPVGAIAWSGHFLNGICVKTSVAMDLTAVYQ